VKKWRKKSGKRKRKKKRKKNGDPIGLTTPHFLSNFLPLNFKSCLSLLYLFKMAYGETRW